MPVSQRLLETVGEEYYPSSDGQPMAETEIHLLLILNSVACLRHFFRRRHNVYVAGNLFLYYQKGDATKRRAPDIMVVKGVDSRRKRRSFKIWEEKAVPRTVIEFTSDETAAEDLGPKKKLYRKLKVQEYFLFDPLHQYLPEPLIGFILSGNDYQPMAPDVDGSLVSEELGLRLRPEGTELGLYDLKTSEKLLPIEDALLLLDEVQHELGDTQQELEAERKKSAELEAELKRLRQTKKRRKS